MLKKLTLSLLLQGQKLTLKEEHVVPRANVLLKQCAAVKDMKWVLKLLKPLRVKKRMMMLKKEE